MFRHIRNNIIKLHKMENINLLKFFLSYFVILSLSCLGFYFAVSFNLKSMYYESLNNQNIEHISSLYTAVNSRFTDIQRTHYSLSHNVDLLNYRYQMDNATYQSAQKALNKAVEANAFLEGVVMVDFENNQILSSSRYLIPVNNTLMIRVNDVSETFPVDFFTEISSSQMIFYPSDHPTLLLYIPFMETTKYQLIYVLNQTELQTLLATGISSNIHSIGIVDTLNKNAYGEHSEEITTYLNTENPSFFETPSTTCLSSDITSDRILYRSPELTNHLSIYAISDKNFLLDLVNEAFSKTYLILVGIVFVGFFFILFALRITWYPLHKLAKKIVPDMNPNMSYVDQISSTFSDTMSKYCALQDKINHYRTTIQRSILDSALDMYDNSNDYTEIDQLFSSNPHSFYVIFFTKLPSRQSASTVKNYILSMFSSDLPCLILEEKSSECVILIDYQGFDSPKTEILLSMLQNFHDETGIMAAVSDPASSPMDIPKVYENTVKTTPYLSSDTPVISYEQLPDMTVPDFASYPYEQLKELTESLDTLDFTLAKEQLNTMIHTILVHQYPDFFIRCILIDMVTIIINRMNTANIKFQSYSTVYMETMFYCRSCDYHKEQDEIQSHFIQLLDLFSQEMNNITIHPADIRAFIEENFLSCDLSITLMADHFHVSVAYMSFLFKKALGENFSDYLWNMRFEKAKDFLLHTDMSIESISTAVGYLNPSSFRRKFKQEIGVSPSSFRSDHHTDDE